MTHTNNLKHSAKTISLTKSMLLGAGIALLLINLLLLQVEEPNPEWPKYWMLRPLIIVPLAGATGGAFYHFLGRIRQHGGWRNVFGIVLGLLIYIIGLWLGTVLGLAGTLWH